MKRSVKDCQLWESFPEPRINYNNCQRKERLVSSFESAKTPAQRKEVLDMGSDCPTCSKHLDFYEAQTTNLDSLIAAPIISQEALDILKVELAEVVDRVQKLRGIQLDPPRKFYERVRRLLKAS